MITTLFAPIVLAVAAKYGYDGPIPEDRKMNQYERVMNRIEGKPVDRIPNTNIIMQFAAREIGVKYGIYATDFRKLVEGNIVCCEKYGIDLLSTISDPFREVADRGGAVRILPDDVPSCHEFLIKELGDLKKIRIVDPSVTPRMRDRIQACALFKKEAGKQFPILGWIEGPMAEACDLRGINEIMTDLFDTPEFIEELLRNCNEQAIRFAQAQVDAGADIIGVGDAAASLIGPDLYRTYVFEREKELIDAIHKMGAKVKLHICGNITSLLDMLPETGADIIDIDQLVDFEEAGTILAGRTAYAGNVDTVKTMLQGTPKDVYDNVMRCAANGGTKLFLQAGCEVPKNTPPENLLAFSEAVKDCPA